MEEEKTPLAAAERSAPASVQAAPSAPRRALSTTRLCTEWPSADVLVRCSAALPRSRRRRDGEEEEEAEAEEDG